MIADVTIAICTYNRCEILEEVLTHLFSHVNKVDQIKIIVVDNNSNDKTKVVVQKFEIKHKNIKHIFEAKQGLSCARNRALQELDTKYIFYLDDDALYDSNMLLKVEEILKKRQNVLCLGGSYSPWYRFGRPDWFKDEYASKYYSKEGLHVLEKGRYISGGVMLFHAQVFQKCGMFDENLGMKGGVLFYGEEVELQKRLRANGVEIFASNEIHIRHVVQAYKLNVAFFFNQYRLSGKFLSYVDKKWKLFVVLESIILGTVLALVNSIKNIIRFLQPKYKIQNYLIDTFTKPYKWFSKAYFTLAIQKT